MPRTRAVGGRRQHEELAYNPDRRRRSSVVEQPPCKRQVVCSIQTGGTNAARCSLHALSAEERPLQVGRNCVLFVLSANARGASLVIGQ